jgi:hypothetical protein
LTTWAEECESPLHFGSAETKYAHVVEGVPSCDTRFVELIVQACTSDSCTRERCPRQNLSNVNACFVAVRQMGMDNV